jgi:hypothetical protein
VHLQAERPNESSALINRDAIPVERVRVGLRFSFAGTKHPDLGLVLWPLSGVRRRSAYLSRIAQPGAPRASRRVMPPAGERMPGHGRDVVNEENAAFLRCQAERQDPAGLRDLPL